MVTVIEHPSIDDRRMEIKSKIKKMLELLQRYKALKYVVVILVAVLIIGFLDENSVWSHFVNQQKINELQEEIDRHKANYKADQRQLQELDSNPKAIEKIARERYFMKADDEDIFVLSDDKRTAEPNNHE